MVWRREDLFLEFVEINMEVIIMTQLTKVEGKAKSVQELHNHQRISEGWTCQANSLHVLILRKAL